MNARFVHGSASMVDYTPSGDDVSAGDVVVIGDEPRIAHGDIADGDLGALAAGNGQGVYEVAKESGSSTAIAAGKKVYWDAGNSRVTETAGSNKVFGRTVAAAGDDDTTVQAIHDPSAN